MNEIEIEHLTKSYGTLKALDNVSLTVGSGQVVGLLGPNGAGKSTLMKIVVGILRPTSGSVSVAGKNLAVDPVSAKRSIGYLPENPSLYSGLTVKEFLSFVGKIRDVPDEVLKDRVARDLATFSLEEKTNSPVGTLSKGMKQKVAIIAAAIHEPKVLVLDEPLTALDPRTQIYVNGWVNSQSMKGTAVLLSTHNLGIAQNHATQIVIIDKGNIIAVGNLQDLRKVADAGTDARLEDVFLKLTSSESS